MIDGIVSWGIELITTNLVGVILLRCPSWLSRIVDGTTPVLIP